jgi:hypothetical protein
MRGTASSVGRAMASQTKLNQRRQPGGLEQSCLKDEGGRGRVKNYDFAQLEAVACSELLQPRRVSRVNRYDGHLDGSDLDRHARQQ